MNAKMADAKNTRKVNYDFDNREAEEHVKKVELS